MRGILKTFIVAGGRDFDDYYTLRDVLDRHMLGRGEVSLVSGHARGVDQMAEAYAQRAGIPVATYPADWKTVWETRRNGAQCRNGRACRRSNRHLGWAVAWHGGHDTDDETAQEACGRVRLRRGEDGIVFFANFSCARIGVER